MTGRLCRKKYRRGLYRWALLAVAYLHALAYMLYVSLHRRPKDEILLKGPSELTI